MEQRMMPIRCHRGFLLITVLIITAVGLLFGAGALLLFRFQCQLRIDRQHELEKVYAVRSALNYTRTNLRGIPERGRSFRYKTESERDLGLIVKPVAPIFPTTNYVREIGGDLQRHFFLERADFSFKLGVYNENAPGFYDKSFDYECGALGVTNLLIRNKIYHGDTETYYGLEFYDTNVTYLTRAKWWINIGMPGTGGWLQEEYGRRYYFLPKDYIGNVNSTKDIVRLCIIRNVTNETSVIDGEIPEGRRHGWPLSQEHEMALVFQLYPLAGVALDDKGKQTEKVEMKLLEYEYPFGETTQLLCLTNTYLYCNIGIQLAHTNVWVFYIENEKLNAVAAEDISSRGYNFLGSANLTKKTYEYFSAKQKIGNRWYGGILKNDQGKIEAPELRVVFEVEGASTARIGDGVDTARTDAFTKFRVTPAYQYDVFLEHPSGAIPQRATVAQKIGKYDADAIDYTMLTYDTHGTEHKGFRYDERHPNGK